MEFSIGYLREVLPQNDPPLERVPSAVREAFPETGDFPGDDENRRLIRRSALWTYAIFSEIRGGYFEPSPDILPLWWPRWQKFPLIRLVYPAWREVSVGVFDQQYEGSGFGLIAAVPFGAESAVIGEIRFLRLGYSFPIALRALVEEPHFVHVSLILRVHVGQRIKIISGPGGL